MKIKNKEDAVALFEINAMKHAEATEAGDYKKGNACYKLLRSAKDYLETAGELPALSAMLDHPSAGPRMWAAAFLLPVMKERPEKVLEKIAAEGSIHALTAETTLSEWRAGNLTL